MISPLNKIGGQRNCPNQLIRLPNFMLNTIVTRIPTLQNAYSWKQNQGNMIIYERLDHVIASNHFCTTFSNTTTNYGTFTISNHAPLFLDTHHMDHVLKPPLFPFPVSLDPR